MIIKYGSNHNSALQSIYIADVNMDKSGIELYHKVIIDRFNTLGFTGALFLSSNEISKGNHKTEAEENVDRLSKEDADLILYYIGGDLDDEAIEKLFNDIGKNASKAIIGCREYSNARKVVNILDPNAPTTIEDTVTLAFNRINQKVKFNSFK